MDYGRQHIYAAGHSAELAAAWLEQNGVRRPFLVCGKSAAQLPGWSEYLSSWPRERLFSGFSPNPVYEDAQQAARQFAAASCDAMIALGGGSAIDVAKAAKLFAGMKPENGLLCRQGENISEMPFLAVPTTAGTGSESTHFAVVYRAGKKQSLADSSILPTSVLLDGALLKNLPLYQKQCTFLDALCQCVESVWARGVVEESRFWACAGIQMLLENMGAYFAGDAEAARQVLLASNYSGRAINLSKTTAAHALSYGLTAHMGIPHGHAVALALPPVWRLVLERAGTEREEAALRRIDCAFGAEDHDSALARFCAVRDGFGLSVPKVGPEILPELEGLVNAERLANTPVELNSSDIAEIYKEILTENELEKSAP